MTLTSRLLFIVVALVLFSVGIIVVLSSNTLDSTLKSTWALLFGGLDAFVLVHL